MYLTVHLTESSCLYKFVRNYKFRKIYWQSWKWSFGVWFIFKVTFFEFFCFIFRWCFTSFMFLFFFVFLFFFKWSSSKSWRGKLDIPLCKIVPEYNTSLGLFLKKEVKTFINTCLWSLQIIWSHNIYKLVVEAEVIKP